MKDLSNNLYLNYFGRLM